MELTAERARAAQETVDIIARIHEGQRVQSEILVDVKDTLREMVGCTRRVEGISTAVAAYLSSRNGADLSRLQRAVESADVGSGISVHVEQQAGGMRAGKIKAGPDRDVNIAGGNIRTSEDEHKNP